MRYIRYFDIKDGSLSLFNLLKDKQIEVVGNNPTFDWEVAEPFYRRIDSRAGDIVAIPTWPWQFDSVLQLVKFLAKKTNRDGYYIITGRNCDKETPYKNGDVSCYWSCFGLAYSPEPVIQSLHHWTGIKKNSELPIWLKCIHSDKYKIENV